MTKVCLSCRAPQLRPLLDFGRVPLTNRFAAASPAASETTALRLGRCGRCGLVQLVAPPPAEVVRARVDWIAYQEPEAHLDDLVGRLLRLAGVSSKSVVAGLSSKDDSTLRRLRARGIETVWRIDPKSDLEVVDRCAGIESVPERLDSDAATRIVGSAGASDVVLARHVLEHAADLPRFAAAVKRLVSPTGYVVWEVPDCSRSMELGDFTMPWEEHVSYFTPATLRLTLEAAGFSVESLIEYPYPRENSLVAICRVGPVGQIAAAPSQTLAEELARAAKYAEQFGPRQARCEEYVAQVVDGGGKVGLFGAGHASIMFLQLMRLAPYIECCFDDDPNKQGLVVPGTTIPIRPSSEFAASGLRLCLLGVGQEAARRIAEKQRSFTEQGGRFVSIFAADERSIAALTA